MGQGCFGKCCGFGMSACDSGKLVTAAAGESTDANLFWLKPGLTACLFAIGGQSEVERKKSSSAGYRGTDRTGQGRLRKRSQNICQEKPRKGEKREEYLDLVEIARWRRRSSSSYCCMTMTQQRGARLEEVRSTGKARLARELRDRQRPGDRAIWQSWGPEWSSHCCVTRLQTSSHGVGDNKALQRPTNTCTW